MISVLQSHWRRATIFLLALIWLIAFPLWSNWVTADPLNEPITLAPAGRVEKVVAIPVPETYSLHFVFDRAGIPFEQLKTAIGDMGLCPSGKPCSKGVRIPVRWNLRSETGGKLMAGGQLETEDTFGWSQDYVIRRIGTISVAPGRYLFTGEITKTVPELSHLKTSIAIKIQPKRTTSWQLTAVFFGAIAQYFVVLPIAVYTGVTLLWKVLRSKRPRPGPANS